MKLLFHRNSQHGRRDRVGWMHENANRYSSATCNPFLSASDISRGISRSAEGHRKDQRQIMTVRYRLRAGMLIILLLAARFCIAAAGSLFIVCNQAGPSRLLARQRFAAVRGRLLYRAEAPRPLQQERQQAAQRELRAAIPMRTRSRCRLLRDAFRSRTFSGSQFNR